MMINAVVVERMIIVIVIIGDYMPANNANC